MVKLSIFPAAVNHQCNHKTGASSTFAELGPVPNSCAKGMSPSSSELGSQGGLAIALSVSFLFRARREEAKIRLRRSHLIG